uniref:Uncharacterized protein n=1 Tax=Caudovirales sp. ctaix4 TaxID=2827635 RepID=A0A8S5S5A9_9CAUD|nr:MAG TPA: hypothetical protein [Caudovirales sp. ctaix4]
MQPSQRRGLQNESEGMHRQGLYQIWNVRRMRVLLHTSRTGTVPELPLEYTIREER